MRFKIAMICLFAAAFAFGCARDHTTTQIEYRPRLAVLSQMPAPYSDVYLLWQWVPQDPPQASGDQPGVAVQIPCEVGQAYANAGEPLGFRRDNGQLIAVAGATTKPLVEAHYSWQSLPGATVDGNQPEVVEEGPSLVQEMIGEWFLDSVDIVLEVTEPTASDPVKRRNYDDRHEREKHNANRGGDHDEHREKHPAKEETPALP